jgi:hypothetical protein
MRNSPVDPYTDEELLFALLTASKDPEVLWTTKNGIMYLAGCRILELKQQLKEKDHD